MFWNWYRETWYSLRNQEYDHTNPKHLAAAGDVVAARALPIPQEALSFQVRVEGLSRVALAQFTRGRIGWAYVVTSQMPEAIEHAVTVPTNVYDFGFGNEAEELVAKSQELYDKMFAAGIPPQDCRYLTIHGQQTNLTCVVNFMALKGYFARRCENGLTDELNLVGRKILCALKKVHLNTDGSDKIPGSGWSFLMTKLEAMGGSRHCLNSDKVFGNTGRAESAGLWVPSLVNENNPCDFDFSKSAWFRELLELPDELLFSGEREMINDWKTIGFKGRLNKLAGRLESE
tara:strand:+ start:438 stop:1301 length:864 start_codon:yes stop_codon:yes gene_type:complete